MFRHLIPLPEPADSTIPLESIPAGPTPSERLIQLAESASLDGSFVRLMLSSPKPCVTDSAQPSHGNLKRVDLRPIQLHGRAHWQWVFHHERADITKNFTLADSRSRLLQCLSMEFGNAQLDTQRQQVQFAVSRKGRATLRVGSRPPRSNTGIDVPGDKTSSHPSAAHNREKNRWVDLNHAHWIDLGVAQADHSLVPSMASKWKQINKFVEIVGRATKPFINATSPDSPPLRIVDFGAGKGYLTFALHEYLSSQHLGRFEVQGVELRPELVALGEGLARTHDRVGLSFRQGDVSTSKPTPCDVMIALHACDTATDHALHLGVRAGAKVLVCSPCCHRQLRPQMRPPAMLQAMYQHGVHLGQEADMVTDSLRALVLEANGYQSKVFEFISLEHTNKNKMLLAVKSDSVIDPASIWAQIDALKSFWGLREQALETLLRGTATAP